MKSWVPVPVGLMLMTIVIIYTLIIFMPNPCLSFNNVKASQYYEPDD
jgi:hypothetical protein